MKTFKLLLICVATLLFATTSCIEDFTIQGNGITETEGRITRDFEKVKSEGDFNIHITNGSTSEVIVNAETNILPYIETAVVNNTLRIYIRGVHNIKNQLPMEVFITTPELEGLIQSGSGHITTDHFSANDFDLTISGSGIIETSVDSDEIDANISGSGNLIISGDSRQADFFISGSGKIDGYDLQVHDCEAKISGSGNIRVSVQRYLVATISGSGSIFYLGTPEIQSRISGSGNIIQDN